MIIYIAPRPVYPPESAFVPRPLKPEQEPYLLANNTGRIITSLTRGYGDVTNSHDPTRNDIAFLISCPKNKYVDLANENDDTTERIWTALGNIYDKFQGFIESMVWGGPPILWAPPRSKRWIVDLLLTLLAPFDCQFYLVDTGTPALLTIWTDFQASRLPHIFEKTLAMTDALQFDPNSVTFLSLILSLIAEERARERHCGAVHLRTIR